MDAKTLFSIEGRVVVMVGGKGIFGNALAESLAESGAKLFIAARSMDPLNELADRLNARGFDVTAHHVDLGDEASILKLRDFVLERAGRVDALVNNAVLRIGKGWDCPAEDFDRSMHVNGTGVFLLTRAFGDLMAERMGGAIVHVGSMQGMIGPDPHLYTGTPMSGYAPDYFMHKGGLINFVRFSASYYGSRGVRVNCVSPGGCESEGNDHALFRERYAQHTCLGRMAKPEELVGSIIFMISDASIYITGANLPVDGGYTAK